MHKNIILFFGFAVYFAVIGFGLYTFEVGILGTSLALFGVPAYALARYSRAPGAVLICVATLSFGLACILEVSAVTSGLWVTQGIKELAILNVIQFEALLGFVLQVLFLVLLYELFFDDGTYTQSSAQTRLVSFLVFGLSLVILALVALFFRFEQLATHMYLYVLGGLLLASVAALGVYRTYSVQFFDKLVNFTALSAFPLLIATVLAVTNGHKVFAGTSYLGTLQLGSSSVPFEVVLLIFVIPFLVGTMYEVYLDDRS